MARQKLPVRAKFKQMAYSPTHEFPFHFVGMIEEQKRYVITGLTQDQAKVLYEQLGKVLNETDTIQH